MSVQTAEVLTRELNEGEYASYTLYHIERRGELKITYIGQKIGCMKIFNNGALIGSCSVEDEMIGLEKTLRMTIEATEQAIIQMRVQSGKVQIKSIKFAYELNE